MGRRAVLRRLGSFHGTTNTGGQFLQLFHLRQGRDVLILTFVQHHALHHDSGHGMELGNFSVQRHGRRYTQIVTHDQNTAVVIVAVVVVTDTFAGRFTGIISTFSTTRVTTTTIFLVSFLIGTVLATMLAIRFHQGRQG